MSTVNFRTRSIKKQDNDITIELRLRKGKIDRVVSTGITIPAKYWNNKKGKLKDSTTNDEFVLRRLEEAEMDLKAIKNAVLLLSSQSEIVPANKITECIESYLKGKRQNESPIPSTMNEYVRFLISRMENGKLLTNGKPYSEGTIKAWRSFSKTWEAFQSTHLKRTISFHEIGMDTYSEFILYCDSIPYKESTKSKYLTTLKVLMNYALEDGISENVIQQSKKFSKKQAVTGNRKPYLNEDELECLISLDLERDSLLEKVRDVFLIGCFCGQRVSDYGKISKENIDSLHNGTKVFRIKQQKTGTIVVVPFLNNHIEYILRRWDYALPNISDVLINRHIKTLSKMANISQEVTVKEIVGGATIIKKQPKYELITTHTARRSCITNLYLSNKLDTRELMSISGHKTEASFNQYLCFSDDEMAAKIASKF